MARSLRTPSAPFSPHLSNGALSSDTGRAFHTSPVQWRAPFGHRARLSRLTCPMARSLQTPSALFCLACPMARSLWTPGALFSPHLSNDALPLDTERAFLASPVQWRVPFGHRARLSRLTCPMARSLWTPGALFSPHLSNGAFPLDTERAFLASPVQWRVPFGHRACFSRRRLSNGAFPSGHRARFSRLTCPMARSLWTPGAPFSPHLSNGVFPLDTGRAFLTSPVQWLAPFGHRAHFSRLVCPMTRLLLTPGAPFSPNLSNGAFPLDTGRAFLASPVRWRVPFGHRAHLSRLACPMACSLWTPSALFSPRLSNGAFPLDTGRAFLASPVR